MSFVVMSAFAPALQRSKEAPLQAPALARIQRKPTVAAHDDASEHEADRVADQIMRMRDPAPIGSSMAPTIQRKCAACEQEDEKRIQAKHSPSSRPNAALDTGVAANAAATGGAPLSPDLRAFFEPRFAHDFSNVRIHADADASRSIEARAYTLGGDIVFGAGEYAPATPGGRHLLAHELTHVVQQGASGAAAGSRAAIGRTPSIFGGSPAIVQRAPLKPSEERNGMLPYREATNLVECTRIMGSESLEYCRREVLGDDVPDAPLTVRAERVAKDLTDLIAGATWKEIRKRAYPRESTAGVARARERKAGTRADLTGLGKISSLEHFAGSIRSIQSTWASLSVDARKTKVGDAANAELAAADVPGFLVIDKQPMEFKGFFRHRDWSFTMSEALVTASTLADADAAELANTALHESRHAEQQFLAARFSAGVNGKDAAGLHAEQDIPTTVGQKAVDKKFDSTTDPTVRALGASMFDATVTHGRDNQRISDDDGLRELAQRKTEAETALTAVRSSPTAPHYSDAIAKRNALRAQIAEVERLYKLYRNIPYEADAHEVGDAAELAFKGWR